MKYSIVIPTYNHCDDLLKPCVETLLKYSYVHDIELIISANGCKDNTREYLTELRQKFDYLGLNENLKVVWHDEPLGYSRATNEGIQVATTDLIVLCNNDVVFFPQEKNTWLKLFEKQFIVNPHCGISCIIKSPSAPAGRDFAVFFLVMIHRKVFNKIGLLNTEYGVGGGEDTEFCIEAEKVGFEVCLALDLKFSNDELIYTGDFPVYHKGEGTMHDKELVPLWEDIFYDNSLRLAKKYNRPWYQWRLSNNWERAVYLKDDIVPDRETTRYKWASQNILGKKVFELGCTTGYGTQFLPKDIEYTGIDYDKRIVNVAKEQNWEGNLTFINADINTYDLDYYDTIIAFEVIEHLDNGLEIVEKLKKHCDRLLITVPMLEPVGKWGPHHKLHMLDESNFPEFTFKYISPEGQLLDQPIVRGDSENIHLMLCIWNKKSTSDNSIHSKLSFLETQHTEIYHEVIIHNMYSLTTDLIQDNYVIDVGAHVGTFSLLASLLGAKRVLAAEPSMDNFLKLCANINAAKVKNIIPFKYAVTDKSNQEVKLSIQENNGHHSLYKSVDINYETVYTTTIFDIISKCEGLGKNIVIKLDCEGAEYDILLNASVQDMERVNRVLVEVHSDMHPLYRGYDVLSAKMKLLGFEMEDCKQVFTWGYNEHGQKIDWKTGPFRVEIWKK